MNEKELENFTVRLGEVYAELDRACARHNLQEIAKGLKDVLLLSAEVDRDVQKVEKKLDDVVTNELNEQCRLLIESVTGTSIETPEDLMNVTRCLHAQVTLDDGSDWKIYQLWKAVVQQEMDQQKLSS